MSGRRRSLLSPMVTKHQAFSKIEYVLKNHSDIPVLA